MKRAKQAKMARQEAKHNEPVKAREVMTFPILPSETVMQDDSLVYHMYVYIMDGVFRRNAELHGATIAEAKRHYQVSEIRRCEMFGHPGARLGDKVQ